MPWKNMAAAPDYSSGLHGNLKDLIAPGSTVSETSFQSLGARSRCVANIADIKTSIVELRLLVKEIAGSRDAGYSVLGAALSAGLALEEVTCTGNLEGEREAQLHRIADTVRIAMDGAVRALQGCGSETRLQKFLKFNQSGPAARRLQEIQVQLEELTRRVWDLHVEAGTCHRSHAWSSSSSDEPEGSAVLPRNASADVRLQLEQAILIPQRLRQGTRLQRITCMLYIPPECSSGSCAAMGQVWWYASHSLMGSGQLEVYKFGTGRTMRLTGGRDLSPATAMSLCEANHVWIGHQRGEVQVWSEAMRKPICSAVKCFNGSVRDLEHYLSCRRLPDLLPTSTCHIMHVMCPATFKLQSPTAYLYRCLAPSGNLMAWVGSSQGDVILLGVRKSRHLAGTRVHHLETLLTLCWADPTTYISEAGRSKQWKPPTSMHGRAHPGSVHAIVAHDGRVWTSGGGADQETIREWMANGQPVASFDVTDVGAATVMSVTPNYVAVEVTPGSEAGCSSPEADELSRRRRVVGWGCQDQGLGWQLVTGHAKGQIIVWDPIHGTIQAVAHVGHPNSTLRSLVVSNNLGLWTVAYADGTLGIRALPSTNWHERQPVQIGHPEHYVGHGMEAKLQVHRMGLAAATGGRIGVITAGNSGTVVLWPEAELRSAAEADGLTIGPTYESAGDAGSQLSKVLRRFFSRSSSGAPDTSGACSEGQRVSFSTSGGAYVSSPPSLQSQSASVDGTSSSPRETTEASPQMDPRQDAALDSSSGLQTGEDPLQCDEDSLQREIGPTSPFAAEPSPPVYNEGHRPGRADPGPNIKDRKSLNRNCLDKTMSEGHNDWIIDFKDLSFSRLIGEGSIGRVHLGRWQETDVAIKSLSSLKHIAITTDITSGSTRSSSEDSRAPDVDATMRTLEREVGILASMRHPNIVLFMGVCLEPPCLVTEWCARGSLYDVLAKAGRNPSLAAQLDWPRRLTMALDGAKGLLQLHQHKPPILHRDLKSPNLLVDKHWRLKVSDFNLSRMTDKSAVVSSISASNPRWLAPEVIRDMAHSKAADVYSFGNILWELATWELPWEGLGPFQIMVAVTEKRQRLELPDNMASLRGGTFDGMPQYAALIDACCEYDENMRPSIEEVIAELRNLLEIATVGRTQRPPPGNGMSVGQSAGHGKPQGHASALHSRAYSGIAPQGQPMTKNFGPSPSLPALPQGGQLFRRELANGLPAIPAASSPPPPALMPFLGSHSYRMRPSHGPGSTMGKIVPQDSVSSLPRRPGRQVSPQQYTTNGDIPMAIAGAATVRELARLSVTRSSSTNRRKA